MENKRPKSNKKFNYILFHTQFGWCGAVRSIKGLEKFFLPYNDKIKLNALIHRQYPACKLTKIGWTSLIKKVRSYFKGKKVKFSESIDFSNGTEFQKMVWKEVLKIPLGEKISYRELASQIGKPRSYRAVGMALSKNPLPLLVPCHRVIKKDGSIGGFSAQGGKMLKKQMLELEAKCTIV